MPRKTIRKDKPDNKEPKGDEKEGSKYEDSISSSSNSGNELDSNY